MYKLLLCMALLLCTAMNSTAQLINQTTKDRNNNDILIGCCTREALSREPYAAWFNNNYFTYTVDTTQIPLLKQNIERKQFLLFMGTWCGDSKREVPRLLKILDYCNVRPEQIKIIMVSNADSMYKQSPTHEDRGLNITRVPTLIVYEGTTEMNRFVEYPVESLEKDLVKIMSRREYKHAYYKAGN